MVDGDPAADPRLRRRVRRDTFQCDADLDAELKQREEKQAIELRDNTERNALRLAESPALALDTSSLARRAKGSAAGDADAATPTKQQRDAQPSPSTPTGPSVLAAVKLLGESIVQDPRVQSLTETVSRGATGLREWFAARSLPAPFEAEIEDEEADRERRKRDKERRRRKREKRRRVEEGAQRGGVDEEGELLREKEERRKRREERHRRRAAADEEGAQ